ncbi:MAG TPA: hypothetical protein VHZ06_04795 [Marmoricola sp.]|jgi:hypothetical protein|nr:hypothetical protein [Marmoricola sp.]
MNGQPAPQLVPALVENLDDRLLRTGTDRDFVLRLCSEAIAFSWTLSRRLPDGHAGHRARNAALLLLELGAPEVARPLREQIALACEVIAIGARTGEL